MIQKENLISLCPKVSIESFNFKIPLTHVHYLGAVMCGYAVDMDGVLVDGVVVEVREIYAC
jgi:hypothetical protein